MSTDKRNTEQAMAERAAKDIEVKAETVQAPEKKKQAKSVSYALKAVRTHIETLKENGLLNEHEEKQMKEIVKIAAETYIKQEYGIG